MKKSFFFLVLLVSLKGLTQDCKNGASTPERVFPKGYISDASSRIATYRTKKNIADSKGKREIDSIVYSPCGFLKLLNALSEQARPNVYYSGLRILLGANANDSLTLVFAPTIGGGGPEDENAGDVYWQINGADLKSLTENQVKAMTARFKSHRDAFKQNGQKEFDAHQVPHPRKKYEETESLWYDISQIISDFDPYDNKTGLRKYLQELINKDEVDAVVIDFGAFEPTEPSYYYQIDLVFDFYKEGSTARNFAGFSPSTHVSADLINRFTKKGGRKNLSSSVNTGVPCPPPPSGMTKCPGSFQ